MRKEELLNAHIIYCMLKLKLKTHFGVLSAVCWWLTWWRRCTELVTSAPQHVDEQQRTPPQHATVVGISNIAPLLAGCGIAD